MRRCHCVSFECLKKTSLYELLLVTILISCSCVLTSRLVTKYDDNYRLEIPTIYKKQADQAELDENYHSHMAHDETMLDTIPYKTPNLHIKPEVYNENFCVYANVTELRYDGERIVMMLHSSAEYFGNNLIEMIDHWKAPLSLAIFSSNDFENANDQVPNIVNTVHKIHQLLSKSELLRKNLFVSVFTSLKDGDCPTLQIESQTIDPSENITILSPFKKSAAPHGFYPANVGRNVARLFGPESEYILFADMDQWYSKDAEERLRSLTRERNIKENKEVLVVRRFEFAVNSTFPETVDELKNRHNKDVGEFHGKYFKPGHSIPKLNEWLERGDNSTQVTPFLYDNLSKSWEPMFVAHHSVPLHDEDVIYGIGDHVQLAHHLCCERYTFLVVDGVFNAHKGIKVKGENRWKGNKRGHSIATAAFNKFTKELQDQYPNATTCF